MTPRDINPISKPDFMPVGELRALQLAKLQKLIPYEYERVPLFRRRCDEKGVKPRDLVTLRDLAKFPFMKKTDLRDEYPYGLTAAPLRDINRFHCSSGTTGKPICIPQTKGDLEVWTDATARCFAMYGITQDDIVQVSYGYGLFTGGLGAHQGAERLGCAVLPTGAGNTEKQIMLMKDLGVTVICCTPSYFLHLATVAEKLGVDFRRDTKLKHGVFGAEPWTNEMRRQIEEELGIHAYDIYGLTEIIGPGVAFECSEQSGMHVNEDHFIVEVIDPDTGAVLPDGEQGELVFTCITKEAFPILRYRTRDIGVIHRGKCACGRTLAKMTKPRGRTDDMLIIRGVNVFPSQIETVLIEQGYAPVYQIVVDRANNFDSIEVRVEISSEIFSDTVRDLAQRAKELSAALKNLLGIHAKVTLMEPNSLPRSEGKAVRVIDRRKLLD